MRKYVVYTRVSTAGQGKSGLGLAAQERDIEIFLHGYSEVPWEVLARFEDVDSGGNDARPGLGLAIDMAKKLGAELLVAKLDRLSRKVSKLAALMEDPKLFIRVASMPHADKFQLHIYAALAEQERDFISARTKAALQAAKARGVKLGGDRNGAIAAANLARGKNADANAAKVMGVIAPLRDNGLSLAAIAAKLNGLGVAGQWSPMKVKRALDRGAA